MAHFSNNRNPLWNENEEKWRFALDHYTGEYVDKDKITQYLYQRMQREGAKAFESRRKDPDPILHFSTAVDGINGIVYQKAKDTTREWGQLGDREDEGSIAYSLRRNADGSGTNWEPLFKQVGIRLTVMHTLWGLVEGIQKTDAGTEQSSIKLINPQSVVDWYPTKGNPRQVLVKENREVRDSIYGDGDPKEVFTLFSLDGWVRFTVDVEKNDQGEEVEVEHIIAQGEYEYWESSKKQVRVLPIFRVELPLPRNLGYLLAKKQNHIFNYKSLRDHGASNLSLALLKIKAGSDKEYQSIVNGLVKGNNTIWEHTDVTGSGHEFMSPDASYLSEAGEILETDVEHFYHNAFREFGDAAKQSTATEIIQKSSTGIEAFLALLVSSIDEFENQCLKRLEQVHFPDSSKWGEASVERSTDFQPEDIDEAFERMKKRYFGDDPVPVPIEQKAELVKKLLEREGVAIEDDESLKDHLRNTIDTKLADSVSRLVGKAMSKEEAVKVVRGWMDDSKVKAEVDKINREGGASMPDPFVGDS